jgi:hypothetical protein
VVADPEVVLTEVERKKLYDMAMEIQELQKRATETSNALTPLSRQMTELATTVAGKADLPADLKASFEIFNKELSALAPRFAPPVGGGRGGGGGGGRGGGAPDNNLLTRLGQAKNGLMGGMWPNEQTMRAYNDSKLQVPKAIAEASALLTKAAALSTALATHNLTLTVPPAVK